MAVLSRHGSHFMKEIKAADKIQCVRGVIRLGHMDWQYYARKGDACKFVNDDDDVIEIQKELIDFVQDETGKSYSINLLINRNRKHEKEKYQNYFSEIEDYINTTEEEE